MIKYKCTIYDAANKIYDIYTGIVDDIGKATIQIPVQAGVNGKIDIEWRYDGNNSNTESGTNQT